MSGREVKDVFFSKMDKIGLALTYGDVRLKTGFSGVAPADVDLRTKFSRNIRLNAPIISAPMDTVTESEMAIAMAKEGGLGIIHRGLSPEDQAREVARVKHHLNGLVGKPIHVKPEQSLESVEILRREKNYSFHSFPVLDNFDRLVGILTRNDFEFCGDMNISVKDIMSTELVTAPKGTSLKAAYEIMMKRKKKILPLLDKKGKLAGMYVFSDVKRIVTGSSADYNVDGGGHLVVGAAIGTGEDALMRMEFLAKRGVDVVVIDTAHGDSKPVYETLKLVKKHFPEIDVVVGNVSVGESAKRLIGAGVDGIKVGQGPGSICTTRIIAGIGRPQVTAVYSCAKAIRGSDVPLCADGGIKYSGDIVIAIGAGANSVMLGRALAGTKEAPGEIITKDGSPYKTYRGMGSLGAMEQSAASRERYRQGNNQKLVPEGVEGIEPYKGELSEVLAQYLGGLRSGMGYVGASTIDELRKKADFDRISGAGLGESHPSIIMTKEAPNYKG